MPLEKPEDFGSSDAGYRVNDYCRFCYQDGAFTEPDVTLEQMIDRCARIMTKQGVRSPEEARTLLTEVMPRLKRWREAAEHAVLQGSGGRGLMAGDEQC